MFRLACGQPPIRLAQAPHENQFLWITFADAFLTMLVSVEEFVDSQTYSALHGEDLYRFIKQLRNITVHRTVLGARKHKHGAAPLVSRIFNESIGGNGISYVDPKLNFKRIRRQLEWIVKHQPKQHQSHVAASRRFIRNWKRSGKDSVILRELFEEALAFVGKEAGITMVKP